jgi:nitroimidazol reductase NimA-like FMN-containing flavoprotein (pyridoxamine 5'-phosphate oxidase superfamily)
MSATTVLVDVDTGFDVLTEEVCRHLLANERVGRLAFIDASGFPVVLPVNYVLDGNRIVVRTDAGAKLDGVPLRRVAFEVEHLAPSHHGGWSVLVQGLGQDVTDALGAPFEELRARPIETWAPGPKEHWLAVDIQYISGRRIRPSEGEPGRS